MKYSFILFLFSFIVAIEGCTQSSSKNQPAGNPRQGKVGGTCEGCEAIYECPVPFEQLSWVDTLPDYNEPGPKLVISGIFYKADGRTPAKDVVLYMYHTDQKGFYAKKGYEKGWGKRHGYIRGWIKTNAKGEYKFYTLKPAPYPGAKIPAHIHATVKEPDKNEYWIDEYEFDDDPLLTTAERNKYENRAGNGIISTEEKGGVLVADRNIYLGQNIPNYPAEKTAGLKSGLDLGANCPAFDPLHLSGADKGKHVCPMCKYGYGQGIMVWFNHAGLDQLQNFASSLESEMKQRGEKKLRVFLVYMNPFYSRNNADGLKILQGKIEKWCREQDLTHVAMLWVPSPVDPETCGIYKINPKAENTVFVYKSRKISAKWVNIDYSPGSLQTILKEF